jgi:hypothetical protein
VVRRLDVRPVDDHEQFRVDRRQLDRTSAPRTIRTPTTL